MQWLLFLLHHIYLFDWIYYFQDLPKCSLSCKCYMLQNIAEILRGNLSEELTIIDHLGFFTGILAEWIRRHKINSLHFSFCFPVLFCSNPQTASWCFYVRYSNYKQIFLLSFIKNDHSINYFHNADCWLIWFAQIAWFFLGVASHYILKTPLGLL